MKWHIIKWKWKMNSHIRFTAGIQASQQLTTYNTLHNATQHNTTLHYTTQHNTTQHNSYQLMALQIIFFLVITGGFSDRGKIITISSSPMLGSPPQEFRPESLEFESSVCRWTDICDGEEEGEIDGKDREENKNKRKRRTKAKKKTRTKAQAITKSKKRIEIIISTSRECKQW